MPYALDGRPIWLPATGVPRHQTSATATASVSDDDKFRRKRSTLYNQNTTKTTTTATNGRDSESRLARLVLTREAIAAQSRREAAENQLAARERELKKKIDREQRSELAEISKELSRLKSEYERVCVGFGSGHRAAQLIRQQEAEEERMAAIKQLRARDKAKQALQKLQKAKADADAAREEARKETLRKRREMMKPSYQRELAALQTSAKEVSGKSIAGSDLELAANNEEALRLMRELIELEREEKRIKDRLNAKILKERTQDNNKTKSGPPRRGPQRSGPAVDSPTESAIERATEKLLWGAKPSTDAVEISSWPSTSTTPTLNGSDKNMNITPSPPPQTQPTHVKQPTVPPKNGHLHKPATKQCPVHSKMAASHHHQQHQVQAQVHSHHQSNNTENISPPPSTPNVEELSAEVALKALEKLSRLRFLTEAAQQQQSSVQESVPVQQVRTEPKRTYVEMAVNTSPYLEKQHHSASMRNKSVETTITVHGDDSGKPGSSVEHGRDEDEELPATEISEKEVVTPGSACTSYRSLPSAVKEPAARKLTTTVHKVVPGGGHVDVTTPTSSKTTRVKSIQHDTQRELDRISEEESNPPASQHQDQLQHEQEFEEIQPSPAQGSNMTGFSQLSPMSALSATLNLTSPGGDQRGSDRDVSHLSQISQREITGLMSRMAALRARIESELAREGISFETRSGSEMSGRSFPFSPVSPETVHEEDDPRTSSPQAEN